MSSGPIALAAAATTRPGASAIGEVRFDERHAELRGDRLGAARFGARTLRRIVVCRRGGY
jgi:hypothetical protein